MALQRGHSLGYVLELADVARPAVIREHLDSIVSESDLVHPVFLREVGGELPEQQVNILFPLPEGRHPDLNGVQSVIKILPELSLGNRIEQVHIGGGYDPDICLADLGITHPDVFSGLEDSQELGLGRKRKFTHLVKEKSSSVGDLKIAFPVIHSSGK